jgi:hypothetical protein
VYDQTFNANRISRSNRMQEDISKYSASKTLNYGGIIVIFKMTQNRLKLTPRRLENGV